MVAEEVFVNCYNFNPITLVKKGNFQGNPLQNYLEQDLEPDLTLEPKRKFGFVVLWSQSRKKYFRLSYTAHPYTNV
jgi:hypothetical protein